MRKFLMMAILLVATAATTFAQTPKETIKKLKGLWLENGEKLSETAKVHAFEFGKYSITQGKELVTRTKFTVLEGDILQLGVNQNPIGQSQIVWVDENNFKREKDGTTWTYRRLTKKEKKELEHLKANPGSSKKGNK